MNRERIGLKEATLKETSGASRWSFSPTLVRECLRMIRSLWRLRLQSSEEWPHLWNVPLILFCPWKCSWLGINGLSLWKPNSPPENISALLPEKTRSIVPSPWLPLVASVMLQRCWPKWLMKIVHNQRISSLAQSWKENITLSLSETVAGSPDGTERCMTVWTVQFIYMVSWLIPDWITPAWHEPLMEATIVDRIFG